MRLDVDFSLAIHNRTGKYFIGLDVLAAASGLVRRVYFWWVPLRRPPRGVVGRAIGRLQLIQARATARGLARAMRRPRGGVPMLHLDPFTVLSQRLEPNDAVLCHDLGPVTHPHLFTADVGRLYKAAYDAIAQIGPHMVFVSHDSRSEFNRLYPRAALRSSRVIYPAIRASSVRGDSDPIPGVVAPFLLTVGYLGVRKNQAASIAGFRASGLAGQGVSYVLCGADEPGSDGVRAAARETEGVVLLSYVPDRQLRWLYQNATGFVLASLLEGFGMPVAEAIEQDLVPVVSANSVLEEVAGDGAITIDPLDPESIGQGMAAVVHLDDKERAERLARLKASLSRFGADAIRHEWRTFLVQLTASASGCSDG